MEFELFKSFVIDFILFVYCFSGEYKGSVPGRDFLANPSHYFYRDAPNKPGLDDPMDFYNHEIVWIYLFSINRFNQFFCVQNLIYNLTYFQLFLMGGIFTDCGTPVDVIGNQTGTYLLLI